MKAKIIAILALLLIGASMFGCNTPKTNDNLPAGDSQDLLNELESTWVDDTTLTGDEMLPSDNEIAASEATTTWIDENNTIDVGEMI